MGCTLEEKKIGLKLERLSGFSPVSGIRSEWRPASRQNPWPDKIGTVKS
jgi:hypothetical protein